MICTIICTEDTHFQLSAFVYQDLVANPVSSCLKQENFNLQYNF